MFVIYMDNFQKPLTGPLKTEYIPRVGELVAVAGPNSDWQVQQVIWFVENSQAIVNLVPYTGH